MKDFIQAAKRRVFAATALRYTGGVLLGIGTIAAMVMVVASAGTVAHYVTMRALVAVFGGAE